MKRLTTYEIIRGHVHNLAIKPIQSTNGIDAVLNRLAIIEDILGDDYDIDRLRELVQADRDERCVVLPSGGYSNKDGERALKNAMFVVSLTNNGANRYAADAIAEKLTRESAESALNEQEVNE